MLHHNHRCPSHSLETASFWELREHLFSNQLVYTDAQYEYSDNPLVIQSTQRLNTLDNEKKKNPISMDALGSLENSKQKCFFTSKPNRNP